MNRKINLIQLILFVVFLLVFSCKKDNLGDNTCNVKDPVKDLAWMKNDINYINSLIPDETQFFAIKMAKYKGESVFYSIYCNPDYDPAYPIRNCAGETIGYYGEILPVDLTEQMVIWKSANCVCAL
jgi:hypothetical protein